MIGADIFETLNGRKTMGKMKTLMATGILISNYTKQIFFMTVPAEHLVVMDLMPDIRHGCLMPAEMCLKPVTLFLVQNSAAPH